MLRIQTQELSIDNGEIRYDNQIVARYQSQADAIEVSREGEEPRLVFTEDEMIVTVLDWLRVPRLNLIHVSDTHSRFPELPATGEIVVHSGDLLPNASRGNRPVEYNFQTQWVHAHAEHFKEWLNGRPFLFCAGNHDFIPNVCDILREYGVDAIDITNTHYEYKGVRFYGFPYVPFIAGEWMYECDSMEMGRQMRRLRDELKQGVDVLVSHAPPHGILDSNFVVRSEDRKYVADYGQRCGNAQLSNYLSYELLDVPAHNRPKYFCCGHVHENYGVAEEFGMTISNAATRVHSLEIKL